LPTIFEKEIAMPWYLATTVYDLKGNLSRFLRALSRGDADCVVVKRYNRPVAFLTPVGDFHNMALDPQTPEDREMRARTYWKENKTEGFISRRPPPPPKWP
jgi:antitoxin (DNA-binding transcriptional repressor) of toxin-antitoxin stability system